MIVEVLEEETVRVVEIRREDDDETEAKEQQQQQRQQQQQQQQQTTYHYPIYNERNRDEPEFRLGSNNTSFQEEDTIICFHRLQVHPSARYVFGSGRRLPSAPSSLLPWGRIGQGGRKGQLSPEPATTKTAATAAAAAGFLRLWRRWRGKKSLFHLLFLPPCEPGRPLRLRLRHEGRGQEGLHLLILLLLLFRRGSVHLYVLARGLRRGGRRAGNYF